MNKFRHYVNEAVNDSPLIRRGQVDKNFIFFEKSTILTKKISRIIYTLVNRKVTATRPNKKNSHIAHKIV